MTREKLIRFLAGDLVSDIRLSERKLAGEIDDMASLAAEIEYYSLCRRQLGELFKLRRTVRLDDFGWPVLESFKRSMTVVTK